MSSEMLQNLQVQVLMMPSNEYAGTVAVASVIAIAAFYGMVRFLRSGRIMQDTPTSKIRSASQGFVEIAGRAKSIEAPLRAPGTGTECAWYNYTIEKHEDSGQNKGWKTIRKEKSIYSFYVDDDTGICAVDPDLGAVKAKTKKVWRSGDYRHTEWRINEGQIVYCLGMFETEMGPSRQQVMKEGTRVLLNKWKQDRAELLRRFDANGDGEIDMDEWQQAREAAKAQTQKELDDDYEPTQHHCLVKPFNKSFPYMISAYSQDELTSRYKWYSIACVIVFLGAGTMSTFMVATRNLAS